MSSNEPTTRPGADPPKLADQRVSLAGRLLALDRSHAIELIRRHGGHYVRKITSRTTMVVVGHDAWPLDDNGQLTTQFQRTRQLEREHPTVEVIGEDEFLTRLGLARTDPSTVRRYSLPELSHLLGIPARQIDRWCRMGLIVPAETHEGVRYFDFAEAAAGRALSRLQLAGVSSARIRRSLRQLAEVLAGRHVQLSTLTAIERGGHLLWRDDRMQLIDVTGQMHLEFEPPTEPRHMNLAEHGDAAKTDTVDKAFALARAAEERGDMLEAAEAYRKALEFGPDPLIAFNLGSVMHKLGRDEEAVAMLADAVDAHPAWSEAWNNLGLSLSALGRFDEARAALQQALHWKPRYADAEFNLADVLDQAGRHADARVHWARYLQYDNNSPWAEHARKRLRDSDATK